MIQNNLFKLFIAGFLSLFFMTGVFGINVILSEQNPDPVAPGNFVYLNVKVSDTSSNSPVTLTFIENENFKIAAGSDTQKNLGVIDSATVVAKYKVLVSENAPIGINTVEFRVNKGGNAFTYEFDVLVEEANPTLQVNEIEIGEINPGKSASLGIKLENTNSVSLKNIVVSLGLDEVEDGVLSTTSGSNEKILSGIKGNEQKMIEFELTASPDAEAKPYILPITLTYEDSLGNSYEREILGSVRVSSEPILSLKLDSQEIYSTGTGKYTFYVANPGTSSIKGTRITVLPGEGYEVIEGEFQYVGDLNPDDFQTVQTEIFVSSADVDLINVKAEYLDSYNNEESKEFSVPIKIYSSGKLAELGLNGATSGGAGFGTYVIALILIVLAYVVGRKRGYKKGKKHNK
ncbi:MAG: COG1361 S-layer family protein [Nanoarchaeota archaeon]